MNAAENPVGGPGAMLGRSDWLQAERAIRNDWPIAFEVKQLVVSEAKRVIESKPGSRESIAAMRVLIAADAINAKREHSAIMSQVKDREAQAHVLAGALTGPAAVEALGMLSGQLAAQASNPPVTETAKVVDAEVCDESRKDVGLSVTADGNGASYRGPRARTGEE